MKIKDFYYDSDNKQDLVYAKGWYPDSEPVGIVQVIHGMTEHTGRFEDLAKFLTDNNYICIMNDHLGHGKTVAKTRGFFGFKNGVRHLLNDVTRLMEKTREKYPDLPYFFLGVSMGSFIERILMAKQEISSNLAGAIIAATAQSNPEVPHLIDIINDRINSKGPKVVDDQLNKDVFGGSTDAFKNENDPLAWVTSNIGKREQYRNDKQSNFPFTNAGLRDLMILLKESNEPSIIEATDSRLPILFISGKDDPIGNFGIAIREIACEYLKNGTDDLTVKIFPKVRHDVLFDFPATQNRAFSFIENWLFAHQNNYRKIR